MSKTQTYKVCDPVKHDGDRYAPGDPIELTDKQARPLLAVGAIKQVDVAPGTQPVVAPTDPVERIAAIKAAISGLDPKNPDLWNKDGKTPDVKVLETLLGWDIKAEERNQAMQELVS